jgi:hypothetical protein
MRLEATVPESRGQAVDQLGRELGLSRSQVIDEALAMYFQAVSAVRGGRRLMAVDPAAKGLDYLIVTPTLTALEWAANPQPLEVSPAAIERIRGLIATPPAPSTDARAAAERFQKSSRRRAAE